MGNPAGKSLGVGGNEGGSEASGVANKSSGVWYKEGGCEAYGVAKIPRGYRQRVGGSVNLPQGIDIPGVAELPRGDNTPGVTTEVERVPGEDGLGWGGGRKPPTTQATEA